MDKNFFNENEENGFKLLGELEHSLFKSNEFGKTPPKHYYDASGRTRIGDTLIEYEVKRRNCTLDDINNNPKYAPNGTLLIESHKVGDLLLDAIYNNAIPIYVNFLENDTIAVVFNLMRLSKRPYRKYFDTIKSKGYERPEDGHRQCLDINDAFIYKKMDNTTWKRIF